MYSNECTRHGACSVSPEVSSFQSVVKIIIQNSAYYVLELKKMNFSCKDYISGIIESIASLVSNTSYSNEQLLSFIISKYNILIKLKNLYNSACKEQNVKPRHINFPLKLTPDMVLSDVLSFGNRIINSKKTNKKNKCNEELLFIVMKSVSRGLLKLRDYDVYDEEAELAVINALVAKNIENSLIGLANENVKLWNKRQLAQFKRFGKLSKVEVSQSTKTGKAILVTGSNLTDLYEILEEITDVDIYTHGDLITSHAFKNFQKFKNLKGHFGGNNDNYDLSNFPGPIVLTRHFTNNLETLIRGRLFTKDDFPPKGVKHISSYKELYDAVELSRGFKRGKIMDNLSIGFDYDEMIKVFDNLNGYENFYIIGSSKDEGAFYNIINNAPEKTFILSFSYCDNNVNYINVGNNTPLHFLIMHEMLKRVPQDKTKVFMTKCDANTISAMISLKARGVSQIYLSDCDPTVINPAVRNTFMKMYGIKEL